VSEAPERAPSGAAAADPQARELRQRYERQLALQHLQRDPAQLDALARLEELRTRLLSDPLPHLPRWVAALPCYTVGSLGAFWTIQRAAVLLQSLS